MNTFALSLCLALLPAGPAGALDNWHHWRGPLATGAAPKANPPLQWDAKRNIKWKAPLPGRGASTPIVWGDLVFVLTAVDTGRKAEAKDLPRPDARYEKRTRPPDTYHQFVVLAFDRHTGKLRWRQVAAERVPHEGHHDTHSYAAGSPTTDGRYLYVSFGSFGVSCYDLAGKLQWQRDLGRMETRLGWGEASTPVVHGNTLLLNWDNEANSSLIALEARTGKTLWQVGRRELTSWATPLVVEHKGRAQVVMPGTNKVRSYDLATGKLVWERAGLTVNCIPSPVAYDGMAVCLSGYRGSACTAIRLDATGDVTGTDREVWTYDKGTPYVPSPLLVGHRLYFTAVNDPILTCLDVRTGKVLLDRKRLPRLDSLYASPVAAAGRIYFVGRDGTTVVIEQGEAVKVLAVNRLNDPIDASPALAGKQLFLRSARFLYCIED
jgi:outer membrane protein assembly factor BamB